MTGITEKLTALSHAGHTTWNEVENVKLRQSKYEEEHMKLAGQISEMLIRMKTFKHRPLMEIRGPRKRMVLHYKTRALWSAAASR